MHFKLLISQQRAYDGQLRYKQTRSLAPPFSPAPSLCEPFLMRQEFSLASSFRQMSASDVRMAEPSGTPDTIVAGLRADVSVREPGVLSWIVCFLNQNLHLTEHVSLKTESVPIATSAPVRAEPGETLPCVWHRVFDQ